MEPVSSPVSVPVISPISVPVTSPSPSPAWVSPLLAPVGSPLSPAPTVSPQISPSTTPVGSPVETPTEDSYAKVPSPSPSVPQDDGDTSAATFTRSVATGFGAAISCALQVYVLAFMLCQGEPLAKNSGCRGSVVDHAQAFEFVLVVIQWMSVCQ